MMRTRFHRVKLPEAMAAAAPAPEIQPQERIVAAAIMVRGVIYSVPRPGRHGDIMRLAHLGDGRPQELDDQGFLTSAGRFVRRLEARDIARIAGQLLPREAGLAELYSEDVW